MRLVVYIAASLLTGLAVSVSGAIGYVGLLVPHGVRLLFGSGFKPEAHTVALVIGRAGGFLTGLGFGGVFVNWIVDASI